MKDLKTQYYINLMDSPSKPCIPRGYPYGHVHDTQPVAHRESDLPSSVVERFPSQLEFSDTKQQKEAADTPLSLLSMSELDDLCIPPCWTNREQDTLGLSRLSSPKHEENIYPVSCSVDSENGILPLQFRTGMLRPPGAIEAEVRQPLPAIENQLQSHQPNLLSEAAEILFEMYIVKMQIAQKVTKKKIEGSLSVCKAPQKVTKALKRQTQFSPGNSVQQLNRRNRPVVQKLRSQESTYQQAFHALPLVIKCLPERLKKRLIAKTKAKALKIAATLLEGWCL